MSADRLVARATPSSFVPDDHDSLIQSYADIGVQWGPLWAKFGAGNVTERQVKSLVSAIQVEVRNGASATGEKVTVEAVEARAHSDPRVRTMLEDILFGRIQFAQAEIDLEICKERLRRLDAVTRRGI